MSKYIKEDNFVSGCTLDCISLNGEAVSLENEEAEKPASEIPVPQAPEPSGPEGNKFFSFITGMGRGIGSIVNVFYQAGRDTLDIVLKNILPFMIFVSIMVGIINYTGIGDLLANTIKPLAGSLPGLLGLSVFCAIPFLSPVLGPGAVIAQVVGVLLGVEIGKGTIPIAYSLPALFAINSQVGCDFVPVALTLAEAEDETVSAGVPAMLFTRLVTGPAAVLVAYLLSFGLYS